MNGAMISPTANDTMNALINPIVIFFGASTMSLIDALINKITATIINM